MGILDKMLSSLDIKCDFQLFPRCLVVQVFIIVWLFFLFTSIDITCVPFCKFSSFALEHKSSWKCSVILSYWFKPTLATQHPSFVDLLKFYLLKIKSPLFSSLALMITIINRRDFNWFYNVVLSGFRKKHKVWWPVIQLPLHMSMFLILDLKLFFMNIDHTQTSYSMCTYARTHNKPVIAQLVERRTVVGWLSGILRSAVRLRLVGSGKFFFMF